MSITLTREHTHTFQQLREWVLAEAGVKNHSEFCALGPSYATFWTGLNEAEYRRGYDPMEYEKPNAKSLCEMKLLTEEEYQHYQGTFNFFHGEKCR